MPVVNIVIAHGFAYVTAAASVVIAAYASVIADFFAFTSANASLSLDYAYV